MAPKAILANRPFDQTMEGAKKAGVGAVGGGLATFGGMLALKGAASVMLPTIMSTTGTVISGFWCRILLFESSLALTIPSFSKGFLAYL